MESLMQSLAQKGETESVQSRFLLCSWFDKSSHKDGSEIVLALI